MKREDAAALLEIARSETGNKPPEPDSEKAELLLIAVVATMAEEGEQATSTPAWSVCHMSGLERVTD